MIHRGLLKRMPEKYNQLQQDQMRYLDISMRDDHTNYAAITDYCYACSKNVL